MIILETITTSLITMVAILLVLNLIFQKLITNGINTAISFSEEISSGNLIVVNQYERKDEIGKLLLSLNQMKNNIKKSYSKSKVLPNPSTLPPIKWRNLLKVFTTLAQELRHLHQKNLQQQSKN
ncbi:HAMP domain protein [Leptospira interrogans serovar Pyrogenes str. 200701872]|uniref:HAMP domain protein n=1 Tax=Leptospira interrogans serovar Pyrogenes str. 200701872 TaxID=1193029 RepID=M6ZKZ3_LEPIR|nr:HAMP domain protein [Leptospira interrogans serovar Pyrogenes str. 200701872]